MKDYEIKVGIGATEIFYYDRYPYEVTNVEDQKHVTIRPMKAIHIGNAYANEWKIISESNAAEMKLVKRGHYWYIASTLTREELGEIEEAYAKGDPDRYMQACLCGYDFGKIKLKGKQTRYRKINIKFGFADRYHDYAL